MPNEAVPREGDSKSTYPSRDPKYSKGEVAHSRPEKEECSLKTSGNDKKECQGSRKGAVRKRGKPTSKSHPYLKKTKIVELGKMHVRG